MIVNNSWFESNTTQWASSEGENVVSLVFRDHHDTKISNRQGLSKTADANVLATIQLPDSTFYIGTSTQVCCDGSIVRVVAPGCKRLTVTVIAVRNRMITTVKAIRRPCRRSSPRRNPSMVRYHVKKRKLLKSTYGVQRQDAHPKQSALHERQRIPTKRQA